MTATLREILERNPRVLPFERPNAQPNELAVLLERRASGSVEPVPRHPRPALTAAWVIAAATLMWIVGVWGIPLHRMTDVGLLSVMRPPAYLALAALVVAFLVSLRTASVRWLPSAYIVTFIVLVHATPPLLYGTLRYQWAWKHVGIVDFISRTNSVDPSVEALDVYHQWPGFFAAAATFGGVVGLDDVLTIASWAPLAFNLAFLATLVPLLDLFTSDRRIVWLACWLFFTANWIGQDYFAPQSMAFFMYLALLVVVLRLAKEADDHLEISARRRAGVTVIALLFVAAITMSHQLTPIMVIAALAVIVVTRAAAAGTMLAVAAVMTFMWFGWAAQSFVVSNLSAELDAFGAPSGNVADGLVDAGSLSAGGALVTWAGRAVVLGVCALAVVGMTRRFIGGHRDWTVVGLAGAPVVLLVTTDLDGEILFRIYMFALPFLALLGAWALTTASSRLLTLTWTAAIAALVLTGFLFAFFGKESRYRFSADEVAAAEFVYNSPVGRTLLVEGSRNYPAQFRNYEQFVYVPIDREPTDGQQRLLADPASVLAEWLAQPGFDDALVILTRSQSAEIDAIGSMPAGSLDRIEAALLASPRFVASFSTADAKVFRLVGGRRVNWRGPIGAAAGVVVFAAVVGFGPAIVVLATFLLFVVPGLGMLRLFDLAASSVRWMVIPAASLAVDVVVGGALLQLDAFHAD